MASRTELHRVLVDLLGSDKVYYQPPSRMEYPCIKYSLSDIEIAKADDTAYSKHRRYEVIVISKSPDHPVIDKLLDMMYASYDRRYVADNLYHDVITLYY